MNYKKIYDQLITRASSRLISGYSESHHIIPKCMGGTNERSNLVKLTPEEHYIAHQLLVKIHPNKRELVMAAVMMIPNRPSNKLYGWLRRLHSHAMSEAQQGNNNSQHNTKWIHSMSEQKSKKIDKHAEIPDGWALGRIIDWDKNNPIHFDVCKVCNTKKSIKRKFCTKSCAAKFNNLNRKTIFDEHLPDMIEDYKSGMSIYKCLVSRNLCGTGGNFNTFKKIIEISDPRKSTRADTSL